MIGDVSVGSGGPLGDVSVESSDSPVTRDRLIAELAAMTRLHDIARGFVCDGDLPVVLRKVADAAVAVSGSDAAIVELLAEETEALTVEAHAGFDELPELRSGLSPGAPLLPSLLQGGTHVFVEDIDECPAYAGSADGQFLRKSGVRSIRSTPLRARSGQIVGILSTLYRAPPGTEDWVLRHLDLLGSQGAEAVERARWAAACTAISAQAKLANQLRESEARFRTTVENMPVSLALYDRDFRILYVNAALAASCPAARGGDPQTLVGKRGDEIWTEPVWMPLLAATERAISSGERQRYELSNTAGGQTLAVRAWTVIPLPAPDGGEVREILAMSSDMTAERRLLDELRETDRRRSDFIAVLSHEVRNPLAAIRSSVHVLSHAGQNTERIERARGVIERQIGQLVRLTDDLLEVTRVTQHKIQLKKKWHDLNVLLRQTVADNREHLERHGVRLELVLSAEPLYVNADADRIAQVVTNLLSNSAKFTPAGGSATLSVTRDPVDAYAVIRVVDTGVGIDPAWLDRLFLPFMQAERTVGLSGGLGVGLALVKGLVELHGGQVRAYSEGRSKGTEITVRLPLDDRSPPEPEPAFGKPMRPAPRRVLVIEDNADVSEALRMTLALDGQEVEVAYDGFEGMAKAYAFRPHVVFCDIGLPGMDGYQIAAAFRKDATLRSAVLVALSGYAQTEDLEHATSAGFDHHLVKPPTLESIRRVLSKEPVEPAERPRNPR